MYQLIFSSYLYPYEALNKFFEIHSIREKDLTKATIQDSSLL